MTVTATETAVLAALHDVLVLLAELAEIGPNSDVATRSLQLLRKYEFTGVNEQTCDALGADLTKGIRDWKWVDPDWRRLSPLIDSLESNLALHLDALCTAPSKSFKV